MSITYRTLSLIYPTKEMNHHMLTWKLIRDLAAHSSRNLNKRRDSTWSIKTTVTHEWLLKNDLKPLACNPIDPSKLRMLTQCNQSYKVASRKDHLCAHSRWDRKNQMNLKTSEALCLTKKTSLNTQSKMLMSRVEWSSRNLSMKQRPSLRCQFKLSNPNPIF